MYSIVRWEEMTFSAFDAAATATWLLGSVILLLVISHAALILISFSGFLLAFKGQEKQLHHKSNVLNRPE